MSIRNQSTRQQQLESIIFGTTTPAGKAFDLTLLAMIIISVVVVMMDSVATLHEQHGHFFMRLEIAFTLLFTVEYFTRIWATSNRAAYLTSFWGIIDLLALLPTYIAFLIPEAAPLLIIRLIRVMRIFRVLSLFELFAELTEIIKVLRNTARTILVFFVLVMIVVVVFACLIYVIEGPEHGFTSIPVSVYWAVVTITTVGYGDLTPQTGLGKSLAAFGMLVGYSILAVPTAIITAKLWERLNKRRILYANWNCPICSAGEHTPDADFCKHCGGKLDMPESVRSAASGLENQ